MPSIAGGRAVLPHEVKSTKLKLLSIMRYLPMVILLIKNQITVNVKGNIGGNSPFEDISFRKI